MKQRLITYLKDTECAEANFRLGIEYYNIGQTSSAAGFLLRAAERAKDNLMIYRCLLVLSQCYMKQGRRVGTVEQILMRAIEIIPDRAEAYYMLSKYLQENDELSRSYLYATLGLRFAKDYKGLDIDSQYLGSYCLLFQKAVSSWWVGYRREAQEIMMDLWENYNLDPIHAESVKNNIANIGYPDQFNRYTSEQHYRLRFKFPESETIKRNYSQVFQDMFVLGILRGKKGGM